MTIKTVPEGWVIADQAGNIVYESCVGDFGGEWVRGFIYPTEDKCLEQIEYFRRQQDKCGARVNPWARFIPKQIRVVK